MKTQNSESKRIGIDCRMWDETGIGRYIRNVVEQISKIDNRNEYFLFLLPKNISEVNLPSNFKLIPVNIRWHTLAEQTRLPLVFLRQKLDILFVPHFNVPILYPGKFVATIHDLTILRTRTGRATTLPYFVYLIKHLAYRINLLFTVKRAKVLFTPSNFVKEDVAKTFNLKNKKILKTLCSAPLDFKPVSYQDSVEILEKYGVTKPYLFYVGNAHPHKNLETLILAWGKVMEKRPDLNLVLGGKKEFFYTRLEQELTEKDLAGNIKFIGYVYDSDLPALYSQAEAFVNPSLCEGFGIQVLEAFSCGTKVICSNSTSFPEVGGSLAFYFDPRSPDNMAEVILESLAKPYNKEAGFKWVKNFSWKESARIILSTLETLAN